MEDFILNCYEDFKNFMEVKQDDLPDLNPILVNTYKQNSGKSPYAYINEDEIGENPIKLYYSQELLPNCHQTFQKAILFHEFTHILDGINFSSLYSGKELASIMATYSEYHAAQIELASKVGFRSIHSCYKMNLSKTFVYAQNQKIKIETDYLHPASDALTIIDESNDAYYNLNEYDYFLNYKTFEAKTMYYLGKKNFCQRYSLKKVPDLTSKWYGHFYPYIQEIEQCIINNKFNQLFVARKELWGKYISHFFYVNMDSLLSQLTIF